MDIQGGGNEWSSYLAHFQCFQMEREQTRTHLKSPFKNKTWRGLWRCGYENESACVQRKGAVRLFGNWVSPIMTEQRQLESQPFHLNYCMFIG